MRRRAALGLALIGAVMTVGCTGSGGSVPSGWQEQRVGALRLALPPEWERVENAPETWSDRWQLVEGGQVVAQVAVEFDVLSNGPKAGLVMKAVLDQLSADMDDFEIVESRPDPVPSDVDAARVRFTYRGQDGASYEGVLWTLGEGREQPAAVQLTSTGLDDDLVEGIDASLAFDPE